MIGPSNHYEADVLLSIIFSSIPANMFVVSHSVDKSEQRHCRIVVHMSFERTIDIECYMSFDIFKNLRNDLWFVLKEWTDLS